MAINNLGTILSVVAGSSGVAATGTACYFGYDYVQKHQNKAANNQNSNPNNNDSIEQPKEQPQQSQFSEDVVSNINLPTPTPPVNNIQVESPSLPTATSPKTTEPVVIQTNNNVAAENKEEKNQEIQEQITSLEAEIKALTEKYEENDAEIKRLKTKVNHNFQHRTHIEKKVGANNARINSEIQHQIEKIENIQVGTAQLEDVRETIATLVPRGEENLNWNELKTLSEAELAEKDLIYHVDENIDSLSRSVAKKETLENLNNNSQEKIKKIQSEKSKNQQTAASLERENIELKQKIQTKDDELTNLKNSLHN